MKLQIAHRGNNSGNVLMTALLVTGIAGFVMGSYLRMVGSQSYSVHRSQSWNMSIPALEAGIEEALAHLNKNCMSNDINRAVLQPTADGWSDTSEGYYKSNALPDGSYYLVTIMAKSPNSFDNPVIVSEGHVKGPLMSSTRFNTMFAAMGMGMGGGIGTNELVRRVRAPARNHPLLSHALSTDKPIDINGNGVATDSFDSSNPAFSTDGRYDPNKARDKGDIATNSGITNSIDVGNAEICGTVSTGPDGTVTIGPNGAVGDMNWIKNGNKGIQPGRVNDDMNVSFPPVEVPFTSGYSTPAGPVTLTNPVVVWNKTNLNTVSGYPAGAAHILTNTATVTTTGFPASGTYFPPVLTNVASTTAVSFPSSYIGAVRTNSVTTTAATSPSSGYYGQIRSNTVETTSSALPAQGTYLGVIRSNTASYTTVAFPSQYIGGVTTNTSSVRNASTMPAPGTYLGTVQVKPGDKPRYDYSAITGYTYLKYDGTYTYDKIYSYTYQKVTGYTYDYIESYTYARIENYTTYDLVGVTNYVTQTYDYVLDEGQYMLSSLGGKVLVRSNAVLYVTGDISFSGQDFLKIQPGGTLKLYAGGANTSLGGQGVMNEAGYATNFWYYGLPSNKSIDITGNGSFIGCIYAPQAALKLNGGGNNDEDFIGAAVTNVATLGGHFKFHYDEALAKFSPGAGFVITGWEEVPVTSSLSSSP